MPDSDREADATSSRAQLRRVLVICNKASGKAGENMDAAIAQLRRHDGVSVDVAGCPDRGKISDLIIAHKGRCDLIVLGGGDGTLNSAARGLLEAQIPLGILPLGTANDLARTLGIPENLQQAVDIVINGVKRRIDLGSVNGIPFFNVASIGLSAELAKRLSSDLKKRFGKIGYAIAAASAVFRASRFRATIRTNEESVQVRTFQIAIGNGLFYGSGMAIEKDAKIDDGALDLYSLELGSVWQLVLAARALRFGDHDALPAIRANHGSVFKVETHRRRPINADGEILSYTPAEFRIMPQAIEVMAAADAPGIIHADAKPG